MSMALSAFGRILLVSSACAVALSVCIGVWGCGCPSSMSICRIETADFALMKRAPRSASAADCEHIPTWISLSGDLAFSHQDGIYGFKFPKRFSELSQAKTSLYSLYLLY